MTVVITTHVRFLLLFFCYAHSPAQHSFPTRRSSDLAMSKLFGGGQKAASKQFRHGATSKSRSNTASNSTKHKSPHLSGWRSEERRVGEECRSRWSPDH